MHLNTCSEELGEPGPQLPLPSCGSRTCVAGCGAQRVWGIPEVSHQGGSWGRVPRPSWSRTCVEGCGAHGVSAGPVLVGPLQVDADAEAPRLRRVRRVVIEHGRHAVPLVRRDLPEHWACSMCARNAPRAIRSEGGTRRFDVSVEYTH